MKSIVGGVAVGLILALLIATQESKFSIERVLHIEPEASVVFGGDVMLDRSVRTVIRERGGDFIFSCVDEILRDADLTVVNLEGAITSNASVSENTLPLSPNNMRFTFDPSVAPLLFFHHIRLVNLGNNHIADWGWEGMQETKKWLDVAGVKYFGDPQAGEEERVARVELNGIPFSFVNWSDWTSDKTDHTVAQVRKEKDAQRVVVVYTHWGEEYVEPLPRVKTLARQFVDAGAAIVIGSHPHIVQEKEEYQGKLIYYSLGNFIFDQYFSEAVRNGLLLRVTFGLDGVKGVEEIPIEIGSDRRPCPALVQ